MDANALPDKSVDTKAPLDAAPAAPNWVQKAASSAYDGVINLVENPYVDAALLAGAMVYGVKSSLVSVGEDALAQTVRTFGKVAAGDAENSIVEAGTNRIEQSVGHLKLPLSAFDPGAGTPVIETLGKKPTAALNGRLTPDLHMVGDNLLEDIRPKLKELDYAGIDGATDRQSLPTGFGSEAPRPSLEPLPEHMAKEPDAPIFTINNYDETSRPVFLYPQPVSAQSWKGVVAGTYSHVKYLDKF